MENNYNGAVLTVQRATRQLEDAVTALCQRPEITDDPWGQGALQRALDALNAASLSVTQLLKEKEPRIGCHTVSHPTLLKIVRRAPGGPQA